MGGLGEEVDSSGLCVLDRIATYTWEGRNRKYLVFPCYSPKEEVLGSVNFSKVPDREGGDTVSAAVNSGTTFGPHLLV